MILTRLATRDKLKHRRIRFFAQYLAMIQLNLSAEKQAALEQGAAEAGVEISDFVWEAVQERLSDRARRSLAKAPFEVWKKEFDAFTASLTPRNPNFDDSRESIYD